MLAGEAGRHVLDFSIVGIDVFLDTQHTKYSQLLYLICYIAHGLHLWY